VTITATLDGVSGTATVDVTPETLSSITVEPDPITLTKGTDAADDGLGQLLAGHGDGHHRGL
jgi:hypothetical protein